jgi:hypothetical protein
MGRGVTKKYQKLSDVIYEQTLTQDKNSTIFEGTPLRSRDGGVGGALGLEDRSVVPAEVDVTCILNLFCEQKNSFDNMSRTLL